MSISRASSRRHARLRDRPRRATDLRLILASDKNSPQQCSERRAATWDIMFVTPQRGLDDLPRVRTGDLPRVRPGTGPDYVIAARNSNAHDKTGYDRSDQRPVPNRRSTTPEIDAQHAHL